MLTGFLTNLVTPFQDNAIDDECFGALVDRQVAAGVDGVVTGAVIGEGPTLAPTEHAELVKIAVDAAAGRVPVVASTGSNCTRTTIELTRAATSAGAAAALLVTPYYNRPSQEGIFRHFEMISRSVETPIILHNDPARTNVELAPETLDRLLALNRISGLLDETRDPARLLAHARVCGSRAVFFAANELAPIPLSRTLSQGCVSAGANVVPALARRFWQSRLSGDSHDASILQDRLAPLYKAMQSEPEPATVKHALSLVWPRVDPRTRLPITALTESAAAKIAQALSLIRVSMGECKLPGIEEVSSACDGRMMRSLRPMEPLR